MKKVAVVGFGFMGRMHYGIWSKLKGVKVAAVCDSNLAQITQNAKGNISGSFSGKLPESTKVYADFDEMIATEKLDVVDITLPTPLHPVMAIKALSKDLNVLCEKPMAIDAKTCDKMIKAAAKSKGKLMIAQCVRYFAQYAWLKDLVDSGKYGKVVAADFTRLSAAPKWTNNGPSWFLDEAKSGGVILDLHLHDTDYIRHVFGMPKTVSTLASLHADGWMRHSATNFGYDNMVVTSSSSWAMSSSFAWESGFRVVFEQAVVVANTHSDKPTLVYPEKGKPFEPKFKAKDGYEEEIKAFLAYLNGKLGEVPVSPESARDSVAIVDAERKSAKTGKVVTL